MDMEATIREMSVTVSMQPLPTIDAYDTELKLLFQNLISNAVKFRKKEGGAQISIEVVNEENDWLFQLKTTV